jgi:hypothetical protein
MSGLNDNPLIQQLLKFGLPPEDFAVFGSGPMMARGIKESHDLDIIARGAAWSLAQALGQQKKGGYGGNKIVLADGLIEIFDSWGPDEWDTDWLIDTAEVIEGIRFVTLQNVLKWKKLMGRPKDIEHIGLIETYLAAR